MHWKAVNLLVDLAQLDKLSAIAEERRNSQSPTQPSSYMDGNKQIMRPSDDCEELWESRFSLTLFHDRLLSPGSVPMKLVRTALLEQL